MDGKVIFSEETVWDPYFQPDPEYHFEGIMDSLKKAAAHLPRVDAIGGSAAGGYFWWRHYQKGPAYSLAVLAEASQRDDMATIDSIVDGDKVADDFVSQVRQRIIGSSALTSQLESVMSSLTPGLKQTVHDELVKELHRLTEPAARKPFIVVALAITRFATIKQENDTAHAQLKIKDEQLQPTMQKDTGRWRITAVQDDKLVQVVADGVTKNLPATVEQLQDEIRKQADKLTNPER